MISVAIPTVLCLSALLSPSTCQFFPTQLWPTSPGIWRNDVGEPTFSAQPNFPQNVPSQRHPSGHGFYHSSGHQIETSKNGVYSYVTGSAMHHQPPANLQAIKNDSSSLLTSQQPVINNTENTKNAVTIPDSLNELASNFTEDDGFGNVKDSQIPAQVNSISRSLTSETGPTTHVLPIQSAVRKITKTQDEKESEVAQLLGLEHQKDLLLAPVVEKPRQSEPLTSPVSSVEPSEIRSQPVAQSPAKPEVTQQNEEPVVSSYPSIRPPENIRKFAQGNPDQSWGNFGTSVQQFGNEEAQNPEKSSEQFPIQRSPAPQWIHQNSQNPEMLAQQSSSPAFQNSFQQSTSQVFGSPRSLFQQTMIQKVQNPYLPFGQSQQFLNSAAPVGQSDQVIGNPAQPFYQPNLPFPNTFSQPFNQVYLNSNGPFSPPFTRQPNPLQLDIRQFSSHLDLNAGRNLGQHYYPFTTMGIFNQIRQQHLQQLEWQKRFIQNAFLGFTKSQFNPSNQLPFPQLPLSSGPAAGSLENPSEGIHSFNSVSTNQVVENTSQPLWDGNKKNFKFIEVQGNNGPMIVPEVTRHHGDKVRISQVTYDEQGGRNRTVMSIDEKHHRSTRLETFDRHDGDNHIKIYNAFSLF